MKRDLIKTRAAGSGDVKALVGGLGVLPQKNF